MSLRLFSNILVGSEARRDLLSLRLWVEQKEVVQSTILETILKSSQVSQLITVEDAPSCDANEAQENRCADMLADGYTWQETCS